MVERIPLRVEVSFDFERGESCRGMSLAYLIIYAIIRFTIDSRYDMQRRRSRKVFRERRNALLFQFVTIYDRLGRKTIYNIQNICVRLRAKERNSSFKFKRVVFVTNLTRNTSKFFFFSSPDQHRAFSVIQNERDLAPRRS